MIAGQSSILSRLQQLLLSPNGDTRITSARALLQLNSVDTRSAALRSLLALQHDVDHRVRRKAVLVLGEWAAIGGPQETKTGIRTALDDSNAGVRRAALSKLGAELAARDPGIILRLHKLLSDPEAAVRLRAIELFGQIGASAPGSTAVDTVDTLLKISEGADVKERIGAMLALWQSRAGEFDEGTVFRRLLKWLHGGNRERTTAADGLKRLMLSGIRAFLNDDEVQVWHISALAGRG